LHQPLRRQARPGAQPVYAQRPGGAVGSLADAGGCVGSSERFVVGGTGAPGGARSAGLAVLLVGLAFGDFLLGRHLDLVLAARRTLEVLDAFAERVADLGQLPGAEHQEHDDEQDDEFAETEPHGGPPAPTFSTILPSSRITLQGMTRPLAVAALALALGLQLDL